KQSGGHMKIYSEVGHGTVVRLYLPRAQTAAPVAVPGAPAPPPRAATGQLILVVEDNAEVRRTAVAQLADLGYRTLEAADAREAPALRNSKPRIALIFPAMLRPGGMTGWELGEAVKETRPDLPVLYTSGFSEASIQSKAQLVAKQFLGKPYRKHELAGKISELLGAAE